MFARTVSVIQKEIAERLAELDELLTPDRLSEAEVAEAAVEMERLRSMAEARCARTAALLESSQAWVADGARSAKDWLAWRTHAPRRRVAGSLQAGRWLRCAPRAAAAFAAGDLTQDHVRLLASAQRAAPTAYATGGEDLLVDSARELLFSQFERAVRYWRHRAAPDDAEAQAWRRYDGRHLHADPTFEGSVSVNGMLDPVGGAVVRRELERLAAGLFEEDLAEARQRLGTERPPLAELRRSAAQRRADALVLMAERSAAREPGSAEPRYLLQVLAGTETVERMCQLSTGEVLTPGEVLPILTNADVQRVVFGSRSTVIDVGERRRLFTGATRTAIQLRDLTCTHPTCDVPFERCEVDHIVPWADGGPTVQANGRCRCPYHHRRARDG